MVIVAAVDTSSSMRCLAQRQLGYRSRLRTAGGTITLDYPGVPEHFARMTLPLLAAIITPRLLLGAMWLFGDRVQSVFEDKVLVPAVGLALFPWATIMYVVAWVDGQGLTSGKWILVGLAAFADVITWFARMPAPAQVSVIQLQAPEVELFHRAYRLG
jgi:hypothetical protein